MADGVNSNMFLVNAPAGSGKTTWIRKQVESYLLKNPDDGVLCITFTNRAAEELGRGLDGTRVYVGTIHSFLNSFIKGFFSHKEVIDQYFEVYGKQIVSRIENAENSPNWNSINEKYINKYGKLDLETVHENIRRISYNETQFSDYYRGALSHNDLISFTRRVVDRFPVIKKKIADKYQLVFIDEYQDTAADVIHIFYESIAGTESRLFLLGDKMQQIYSNYNGEFEEQFSHFDRSVRLAVNYRTTPKIVKILNAIYNDPDLEQIPYKGNTNDEMAFMPKVLIVENVEKTVSEFQEKYDDALILYLSNRARFRKIGVVNLFDAFNQMEKYRFGKKFNAVDVLTKTEVQDNDALMSLLFLINKIYQDYQMGLFGEVLKCIHINTKYFNSEKYCIRLHSDKEKIKVYLDIIAEAYNDPLLSIGDFLNICLDQELIKKEYLMCIEGDSDYVTVRNVNIQEVKLLFAYLENPNVSTQHGVKGESHDTVVFVAENSSAAPYVYMKEFFKLWSIMNIKLSEFDDFYYKYKRLLKSVEMNIGCECSKLNRDTYKSVASIIYPLIKTFDSENQSNEYYKNLLKDRVDKYMEKPGVSSAKACLKENYIYGLLSAYRLFYVGCSRAKKNLIVIIKKTDIESFEQKLCDKFSKCGFEVQYADS